MKSRQLLAVGIALLVSIGLIRLVTYRAPAVEKTASEAEEKVKQAGPSVAKGPIAPPANSIVITDYAVPKDDDSTLQDDRIEEKTPKFDPNRIDRRPHGDWWINASDAVIRLDVPIIRPDVEPELLALHPSYKAAIGAHDVLVSVNMIDGKAKQFDDGLYAALDQAYFLGEADVLKSHVQLVRRIFDQADKKGPAAVYLAAGLEVAGVSVPPNSPDGLKESVSRFLARTTVSKPIGFYEWNADLSRCFRFLRFFSEPIDQREVVTEIAAILKNDDVLKSDYRKAVEFYSRLTNPIAGLSLADVAESPKPPADNAYIALFPRSTSRETRFFGRLFPLGLPPDADLMKSLVAAIRSGKIDLAPNSGSGWFDRQAYALETLLLPERGPENQKLLLTKSYKKRMLEAFKALMTKRLETHVRTTEMAEPKSAPAEFKPLAPRLRIKPCPTFYLRTARSYAFLANFLDASVGEPTLKKLHGLREKGMRDPDLFAELRQIRDLHYGLYLLSCEDIGLEPSFLKDEPVDVPNCEKTASDWLATWPADPDLAADTRVAVPIFADPRRDVTRLWMTIGVRLSRVDVSYAKPPRMRPGKDGGEWQTAQEHQLRGESYLIPVDEFAEVELKGMRVLTRAELRAICDVEKTKAGIVKALQK